MWLILRIFHIRPAIVAVPGNKFALYLEEKNKIPVEHQHKKAHSKGFFSEVSIQDFPIRGLKVTLHAKRRRWEVLDDGKIITRDWELVKKGTRMTPEFGAFLKGLLR